MAKLAGQLRRDHSRGDTVDEQQQQEQQKPGDNATENAAKTNDEISGLPGAPTTAENDAAELKRQRAAAAEGHTGLLGRLGHGIEHVTGVEAIQRHEKRRQAFSAAKAGPVGQAVNDVNAFINAMQDCDADTPEEMLADTDVQNAAKRAREGLKVFTGDTPVTFSKPTSDAHLNIGSGGAVTGNTPANKDKAAAVKDEHDDDEETAAAGITNVPQPDAHVR